MIEKLSKQLFNQKISFFTLIEMIVVIVILGILAAIVIPNVSDQKEEAFVSAVQNNIRNLQTGVDLYQMKQKKLPSKLQPTLYEPQIIDYDSLYPNYIKNKPKDLERVFYWVDYEGQVWGSTIDSPTYQKQGETISWDRLPNAKGYEIFEVNENNKVTSSLKFKSKVNSIKSFFLGEEKTVSLPAEDDKGYLISTIDQYGFQSAPAGKSYLGVPQKTDNEMVLPIFTPGTYYFTTNAGAKAIWDGIKVIEDKPEGTDIIYSFASSDDGKTFSQYTSNIKDLPSSQYVRVKVEIKPYNNQSPTLYRLKVIFHLQQDEQEGFVMKLIPEEKAQNIVDIVFVPYPVSSGGNGGSYATLKPDAIKGSFDSYVSFTEPRSFEYVECACEVPKGSEVTYTYQSSLDGINYSSPTSNLKEVPVGSHLKITTEVAANPSGKAAPTIDSIVVYTGSPSKGKTAHFSGVYGAGTNSVSPLAESSPASLQQNIEQFVNLPTVSKDDYLTLQTLYYLVDANEIGDWIKVETEDEQPANTRIIYTFATSNDERSWSNYQDSVDKLPNSRFLNVKIELQAKKGQANTPRFHSLTAHYNVNGQSRKQTVASRNVLSDLQIAVTNYYRTTGVYPATKQPKIADPQYISIDKLYPTYLPYLPELKELHPMVDYKGKVHLSSLPVPSNIKLNENQFTFDKVEGAKSYKLYLIAGNELIYEKTITDNTVTVDKYVGYAVSVVDSNNVATPPAGIAYTGGSKSDTFNKQTKSLYTNGTGNFYLKDNGEVVVWGHNSFYLLGLNHQSNVYTPIINPYLKNIKELFVGNSSSVAAIDNEGYTYVWGNGFTGIPTKVLELGTNAKKVIIWGNTRFAIMKDGTVMGWGENTRGQLALGHQSNISKPTLIPNATNIKDLSTDGDSIIALRNDGTVISWGYNLYGNLGFYTNTSVVAYATPVPNLSNVKKVAATNGATSFLMNDGTLKIIGSNGFGQLGTGTTATYSRTLIDHPLVSNVKDITGNYHGFIALLNDGTARYWGKPYTTNSEYHKPVVVQGNSPIVDYEVGSYGLLFKHQDNTYSSPVANDRQRFCAMTNGVSSQLVGNNVTHYIVGTYYSIYELENGKVVGCGDNYHGFIAQPSTSTYYSKPSEITIP